MKIVAPIGLLNDADSAAIWTEHKEIPQRKAYLAGCIAQLKQDRLVIHIHDHCAMTGPISNEGSPTVNRQKKTKGKDKTISLCRYKVGFLFFPLVVNSASVHCAGKRLLTNGLYTALDSGTMTRSPLPAQLVERCLFTGDNKGKDHCSKLFSVVAH